MWAGIAAKALSSCQARRNAGIVTLFVSAGCHLEREEGMFNWGMKRMECNEKKQEGRSNRKHGQFV
jgi:hypothetical protein